MRKLMKGCLRLFVDRIVIELPIVKIAGNTRVVLNALQNKTAARTGVLTAVIAWLPDSFEYENFTSTLIIAGYKPKHKK
jgi:hypothetical protein